MIFGIGMDIVAISRMQENLDRHGDRFVAKILNANELPGFEQSSRKAHYLAKRFAAKEALVKALGTGFRDGITLDTISISNEPTGQPRINCQGKLQEMMQSAGISACHLTLSDEQEYACACVILER